MLGQLLLQSGLVSLLEVGVDGVVADLGATSSEVSSTDWDELKWVWGDSGGKAYFLMGPR